jgi:succinate dehydrogenase / fumarate reductase flavoprotein subunit
MKDLKELGTVHESQILIIGGACSGLATALTAKEADRNVDILITDMACASKGWAGKAARTAGLISFVGKGQDPEDFVKYNLNEIGFWLNDQHMLRDFAYNSRRLVAHLEEWGVSVEKKEDGSFDVAEWPFPWVTGGIDPDMCKHMAAKAHEYGVRFEDRIEIVKLLKDGERVIGAVGFGIKDGSFHIFLSDITIIACGTQNFDITPIWCGTGVSQSLAWDAGCEFRNCEFAGMGDFARIDEDGHIFYGMHGGAHIGHDHMYVGEENISQKWRPGFHSSMDPYAANAWYQEYKQGHWPIKIDMDKFNEQGGGGEFFKFHPEAFKRYMRHHQIGGYPFDHQVFNVVPGVISELGAIRVGHSMETTVPCLLAIGDSAGSGSARAGAVPAPPAKIHGTGLLNALYMGTRGGESAVDLVHTISKLNLAKNVDTEEVAKIKEETFAPLMRRDGIDPRDIIHEIQEAIAPVDYLFVKSEDRMKDALCIIKDAESKLDRMKVDNTHDLVKAVEAKAMALGGELFYNASIMRKESRGFQLREDYPETDNKNWLKWIIARKGKDGAIELHTEDVPIDQYDYQPA